MFCLTNIHHPQQQKLVCTQSIQLFFTQPLPMITYIQKYFTDFQGSADISLQTIIFIYKLRKLFGKDSYQKTKYVGIYTSISQIKVTFETTLLKFVLFTYIYVMKACNNTSSTIWYPPFQLIGFSIFFAISSFCGNET